MSATFKCNKTGNTVTFKSQYDIESMREHPEYTEVLQEIVVQQPQRGRPKKVVEDTETDSV
jgi:hypothetical protein